MHDGVPNEIITLLSCSGCIWCIKPVFLLFFGIAMEKEGKCLLMWSAD